SAAQWYQKAASQGYAPAQIDLGSLYEQGKGVPKDPQLALNWYRKASGVSDVALQSAAPAVAAPPKTTGTTTPASDAETKQLNSQAKQIDTLQKQKQQLEDQLQQKQSKADVEHKQVDVADAQLTQQKAALDAQKQKLAADQAAFDQQKAQAASDQAKQQDL